MGEKVEGLDVQRKAGWKEDSEKVNVGNKEKERKVGEECRGRKGRRIEGKRKKTKGWERRWND